MSASPFRSSVCSLRPQAHSLRQQEFCRSESARSFHRQFAESAERALEEQRRWTRSGSPVNENLRCHKYPQHVLHTLVSVTLRVTRSCSNIWSPFGAFSAATFAAASASRIFLSSFLSMSFSLWRLFSASSFSSTSASSKKSCATK